MTAADRPAPLKRKTTARDRTRRPGGPSRTAKPPALPTIDPKSLPDAATRPVPRSGWAIIGRKELADHLDSVRFYVLLIVLGLAAVVPLYFASERIRELASDVSGSQAVFLALFLVSPQDFPLPPAATFIAIVAPLLGVAFAFDAVNSERADGTLSRLVSQPIHRDDVINGKFVAGLAVIVLVIATVVLVIAGFGAWRLGIIPEVTEIMRLLAWFGLTILYVSFWLAFGLLLSVVIRRAATAALIGFGAWLIIVIFGPLIIGTIAGLLAPLSGAASADEYLAAQGAQELIRRISPHQLYSEAATVLLNPSITNVSAPTTIGQFQQIQEQIPTLISLDRSILLIWPQVVILAALTAACFALAYVTFMRQEIRA